jgi:hypothetical protein
VALTTSNTFSNIKVDTRTFIDRAYGALKLRPQQITAEMQQIGLDMINLVQQDLVNDAMPLWTLRKTLLSIVQGQSRYQLPTATNDVNSTFYRTMFNITANAVVTVSPASILFQFPQASIVSTANVTFPAGSFPITIQTSPDGINWTTVYTSDIYDNAANGSPTVWYDPFINNAAVYWQIIPSLTSPVNGTVITPPNTMTGCSAQVYNTPSDIMMYRMNRDDFFQLPNKAFPGRPLQYRLDRQITPTLETWPTPDLTSSQNVLVCWRQRMIMDTGSLQQTLEIPPRWYLPLLYRVASELAFCTPEADADVASMVQGKADAMMRKAWGEERDKSPIKYQTHISVYTA